MFKADVDLRNYLVGNTSPPDSVIDVPFSQNQVFIGAFPDFTEANEDVLVRIRLISAVPNTKWLRDEIQLAVSVMGADRSTYVQTQDLIYSIFNTLLASNRVENDDHVYFQFGSTSGPRFVGYQDNSKPLFDSIVTLYVDGLEDRFNRKTLY